VISPTPRPLPDNTQHSHKTDIHALDGIRPRNPNKRAATDPRFRPRGNCIYVYIYVMCFFRRIFVHRACNFTHCILCDYAGYVYFLIHVPSSHCVCQIYMDYGTRVTQHYEYYIYCNMFRPPYTAIICTTTDDGSIHRSKHVAVNMMNT
jgi:hypothetical protein